MAPAIRMEMEEKMAVVAMDLVKMAPSSTSWTAVAVVLFVSICVSAISALIMCGCCKKDDRKRIQEEADAMVPPPPSAPETEKSQMPTGTGASSRAPTVATDKGAPKQLASKPLAPIPADQAHKFDTMALAASGVFDKSKPPGSAKGAGKMASQKGSKSEVPADTLAFADSKVFDKGKSGKAPAGTAPAGPAPLGTLALADSNVFDKGKGGGSAKPAPSGAAPMGTLALAESNVFDKK